MSLIPVELSGNQKTGYVAATYRKVGETCPSTCAHLVSKSCYALSSYTGMTQARAVYSLSDGAIYYRFIRTLARSPKKLAKINSIVRLHVSGDMFYNDAIDERYVRWLKASHKRYPALLGYTYTHRYADFGVYNWPENLVVNASCDTIDAIKEAQALGWPTVTTTAHDDTRKRWVQDGVEMLTCPAQTANLTCAQCKLCMKPDRKFTIAFRGHGTSKKRVVDAVQAHLETLTDIL